MNPRARVLSDEFDKLRTVLDGFDTTAADEARDLSDDERGDYDAAVTRMEQIEAELDTISKRTERFDAVAKVAAKAIPAAPRRHVEVPSFGEQLKVRALNALGKDDGSFQELQRVLQHGTSADGTAPVTIEGDLVNLVDANRYAVNASRRLPMPDNHAPTFKRPRVSGRTAVGLQAAQGDVLESTTLNVTGDTVTKTTYGGTVALSEQEVEWTDPAMLGLTVADLAQQYAIETEAAHVAAIEAAVTTNVIDQDPEAATNAQFITAILAAATATYTAAAQLPDTLFVSPDVWASIVARVDTTGRPLFPIANVTNSAGTNAPGVTSFSGLNLLGLSVVTSPAFSANTAIVAVTSLIEHYEQPKGALQVQAPSTLEVVLAYRGYVASNVYAAGLTGIEDVA